MLLFPWFYSLIITWSFVGYFGWERCQHKGDSGTSWVSCKSGLIICSHNWLHFYTACHSDIGILFFPCPRIPGIFWTSIQPNEIIQFWLWITLSSSLSLSLSLSLLKNNYLPINMQNFACKIIIPQSRPDNLSNKIFKLW